jgi:hypothetical protein
MAIYPRIISHLLDMCQMLRERKITVEEFQIHVANDGEQIVAFEEKELRKFLEAAEGELELIRFTVDREKVFERSLEVVSRIEQRLKIV